MTNDDSSRANWKNPELLKFFIDLCLEEANKRSLCGSSLKKESWERIRAELKEKKNVYLTQKKIKNQWDYMKGKYQTWVSIIGKTGNTNYDPVTNRINWTDEKWEEEIKLNADVKQFRYKPLEYVDEMRALFDGILATGKDAWGPSKEGLIPMDGIASDPHTPIILDENDDFECSSDVRVKQEVKKRKRATTSTSNKVDDIENKLLAAIDRMENSEESSIEECNKLLDEMQIIQDGDPLYLAATCIFCESNAYRKQWVKMAEKSEDTRKGWISMIARKINLI